MIEFATLALLCWAVVVQAQTARAAAASPRVLFNLLGLLAAFFPFAPVGVVAYGVGLFDRRGRP